MTPPDQHSCGYTCERPACVLAQRNELRDAASGDVTEEMMTRGAATSSTGRANDPVYRQRIRTILEAALGANHDNG